MSNPNPKKNGESGREQLRSELIACAAKVARRELLPSLDDCKTIRHARVRVEQCDSAHVDFALRLREIADSLARSSSPQPTATPSEKEIEAVFARHAGTHNACWDTVNLYRFKEAVAELLASRTPAVEGPRNPKSGTGWEPFDKAIAEDRAKRAQPLGEKRQDGADRSAAEIVEKFGFAASHLDKERFTNQIAAIIRSHSSSQSVPETRDFRQKAVAEWCRAAFGAEHQSSVPQRGIRLLEEAIEAYQSATLGLPAEEMAQKAHALVDYVFGRVSGNLAQECGGIGVTLLALCEAAGISAEDEELREIARVKSKPLAHFAARNQTKNDAGFAIGPLPTQSNGVPEGQK